MGPGIYLLKVLSCALIVTYWFLWPPSWFEGMIISFMVLLVFTMDWCQKHNSLLLCRWRNGGTERVSNRPRPPCCKGWSHPWVASLLLGNPIPHFPVHSCVRFFQVAVRFTSTAFHQKLPKCINNVSLDTVFHNKYFAEKSIITPWCILVTLLKKLHMVTYLLSPLSFINLCSAYLNQYIVLITVF